ncbi:MAG UNVERIFIED_CONTAM: flagellar assembly protein FliX [Rickettsiaceae bacterium]|jgi:hypothetical protein
MQVGDIVQKKLSVTKKNPRNNNSIFTLEENPVEASAVSTPRVNISSLWTLQAEDDWSIDVDRMKKAGQMVLDELNNIRMCLIDGMLTKNDMENLTKSLDASEINLHFPELQEMIDDIRLRAAVELAKMGG